MRATRPLLLPVPCMLFALLCLPLWLGCAGGGGSGDAARSDLDEADLVEVEIDMPGTLLVRSDHGIGSYDAFMIPPAAFVYRRGSQSLSEDLEETFKAQLEQTLFDAAEAAEIPVVREPGACVMVVHMGLLEVDVERRRTADPVGQMTLAMEFRDSVTGDRLLRYQRSQLVENDDSGDEPAEQIIRHFDEMVASMQVAGALRAAGLDQNPGKAGCQGLLAQRGRELSEQPSAISSR